MSPTTFDGNKRKTAELLLVKEAQVFLKVDKNFSTSERQLSLFPDDRSQLSLFTDDNGVLRCRGRIDNASNLPYSAKHPVIFPSNHHLMTLYVLQAHARVLHNDVKEALLS